MGAHMSLLTERQNASHLVDYKHPAPTELYISYVELTLAMPAAWSVPQAVLTCIALIANYQEAFKVAVREAMFFALSS
jgi:hypothetical protein